MAKRYKDIDVEKVRQQASDLSHVVSEQAHALGTKAAFFAHEAGEWATPKVEKARDYVGPKVGDLAPRVHEAREALAPKVEKAWKETVKATAPRIDAAADAVRPIIDDAYEKVVDDYLPRLQKAMRDAAAAAAAEGSLMHRAEAVSAATENALAKSAKSHKGAKALGWVLVGSVAAGAGYLLWRRTQPVEDPWAEEYWQDVDAGAAAPTEEPAAPLAEAAPIEEPGPGEEPAAEETPEEGAAPEK